MGLVNEGGHWTLEPDGEIDLSNADLLEQALRRAEASAATAVTIDLRQVEFIDLCGVRTILAASRRFKGRLRLRAVPDEVQCVFRLSGVEARLSFEG